MNEQTHLLRWKGVTSGPYNIIKIQAMLDKGEVSRSHQILVKGQWTTLEEFLPARHLENTGKIEKHAAPVVLPHREAQATEPEYAPKVKVKFEPEPPVSVAKVTQRTEDVADSNTEQSDSWASTETVQAVTIKMSFEEVFILCCKFTVASILISIIFGVIFALLFLISAARITPKL